MVDGAAFFEKLTAIAAVVTLPIGILAGIFMGTTEAAVIFVVGWLLLVPIFAILSDQAGTSDPEEVERWLEVAERARESRTETDRAGDADPLETLQDRYARGEIDEEEFEARVERLLATDLIPPEAADVLASTEEDTGDAEPATER